MKKPAPSRSILYLRIVKSVFILLLGIEVMAFCILIEQSDVRLLTIDYIHKTNCMP